jgi:hypothetical protein
MTIDYSISYEQQPEETKIAIQSGIIETNIVSTDQEYCGTSTLTNTDIYRPTCIHYETIEMKINVTYQYMNPANDRSAFAMRSQLITIEKK